jgi:hypothetical protein
MKYLCLIHDDEQTIAALPQRELHALERQMVACRDELQRNGACTLAQPLQPASLATTLRLRNGRLSVTDGPYAETNEHLGGFFLIDARDLNDAIRIASHLPVARFATIEVRPVEPPEPDRSIANRQRN